MIRTSYTARRSSSPWIALWLTPRHTLKELLRVRSSRPYTIVLIFAMGWVWSIEVLSLLGAGLTRGAMSLALESVVGGMIAGLAGIHGLTLLLLGIGRAFGGTGEWRDVYKLLVWSNVPLCVVLILILIQLQLVGSYYFMAGNAVSSQSAALVLSFFKTALMIWGWYLTVLGVAQAHRCSFRRAAMVTLLAFAAMAVIAICVLSMMMSMALF